MVEFSDLSLHRSLPSKWVCGKMKKGWKLNIKAPIAIITIDRDEGIPILRISPIIFGFNFRYFREHILNCSVIFCRHLFIVTFRKVRLKCWALFKLNILINCIIKILKLGLCKFRFFYLSLGKFINILYNVTYKVEGHYLNGRVLGF